MLFSTHVRRMSDCVYRGRSLVTWKRDVYMPDKTHVPTINLSRKQNRSALENILFGLIKSTYLVRHRYVSCWNCFCLASSHVEVYKCTQKRLLCTRTEYESWILYFLQRLSRRFCSPSNAARNSLLFTWVMDLCCPNLSD